MWAEVTSRILCSSEVIVQSWLDLLKGFWGHWPSVIKNLFSKNPLLHAFLAFWNSSFKYFQVVRIERQIHPFAFREKLRLKNFVSRSEVKNNLFYGKWKESLTKSVIKIFCRIHDLAVMHTHSSSTIVKNIDKIDIVLNQTRVSNSLVTDIQS